MINKERVLLRWAVKAHDHKAICALAKQTKWTKDFSNEVMFSNEVAYSNGWVVVAEDVQKYEHVLLGFYCIREKKRRPETELYFLGVDEAQRGQGIGQMLMGWLKLKSKHPTITFNVEVDNHNARKFYEKQGCECVSTTMALSKVTGNIEPKYWRFVWRIR